MDQWLVGRRKFVLGGAAAAGAVLCAHPLRALGRLAPTGDAGVLACEGSEAWEDLASAGVIAKLQESQMFTAAAPTGAAIAEAARMTVIGGALSGRVGVSAHVRVEFPKNRVVEAMGLRPDESTTGITLTVPTSDGEIGLRLAVLGADDKQTEQRVRVPARRGVYAVVVEPGATGRVRWTDGRVSSDAACCVVLSLESAGTGKSK